MKAPLLPILLILASTASAQKITTYYDFEWKTTDVSHARFVSLMEHTDSGWHRQDYYVQGPTLQMEGWYDDSACKIRNGKFIYGYPDGKMETSGHYVHGKKQGLWLTYHPNGMMADSVIYEEGEPRGTNMHWHRNGFPSDSAIENADGSGIEVSWFDNGYPSAAGRWATGHKRQGRWQFFHSNGHMSAMEIYDHGQLTQKQYFDENGQPLTDTSSTDHKCSFGKDSTAWLKYLERNLMWPNDYKIVNGDLAAVVVSFTVDVDGTVKDAYISTPFVAPFNREALKTISRAPKWHPAMEHNRAIQSFLRQPVIFRQPSDY